MNSWVDNLSAICVLQAARRMEQEAKRRYPDADVQITDGEVVIRNSTAARDEFGDSQTDPSPWVKEAANGR